MVSASREQMQQEALTRAATGQSFANWPAIIAGFTAKGIAESDIRPRENVFTYQAWRALGRQVRRGEHGVKVTTFVSIAGKEDRDGVATNDADGTDKPKRGAARRPWTATVFHISQTDPIQPEREPIGHAATAACANSGM
jgi:antirestriction protein ArdC